MDAPRELASLCRGPDEKGPSIGGADFTRNESTRSETIEDAREGGSLVREPAMEIANRGRARRGEVRQDVGFALGEIVSAQRGQIEADAVRRSMNERDEAERHRG